MKINPAHFPDVVEVGEPSFLAQPASNVRITLQYGGMSVEMIDGMEISQIAELMIMMALAQLTCYISPVPRTIIECLFQA